MFKMTDFKRCIFKHHTRISNALLVQLVFTALCKWLGWALLNWSTQDIWLLCAHLTWSKTKLLINHKTAGAETQTAPIVSTFLLHPCNLWFTCFWYQLLVSGQALDGTISFWIWGQRMLKEDLRAEESFEFFKNWKQGQLCNFLAIIWEAPQSHRAVKLMGKLLESFVWFYFKPRLWRDIA